MTSALTGLAIVLSIFGLGFAIIRAAELISGRLDSQNYLLDKIVQKLDRAGEGG